MQTLIKKSEHTSGSITVQDKLLVAARDLFVKLEYLQNSSNPNKQGKIVAALIRAVDKFDSTKKRNARLKASFLEKYAAKVHPDGKVQFTIPKGSSALDLLQEAQTISYLTRGVVAVYPPRLAKWKLNKDFTKPQKHSTSRVLTACVRDSNFKSRSQQTELIRKNGLEVAEAWELAVAHAIYSVYKGVRLADLFKGNIVRVKGTKLYYGDGGLSEMDESDYVNNCSYRNVRMASVKR